MAGPSGPVRFAHLRVRSTFSLRDATITPERLAVAAAAAGMTHVALTDRDGLSGAVRFVRAAADAGIAPVVGVDLGLDLGLTDARVRRASRMRPATRRHA
jgi:error-prone DNA polymerase